jgi:hypothetical protein
MRGTAVKNVNNFARVTWERTAEEDRPASYKRYRKNVKKEYVRNAVFREFVKKYKFSA